MKKKLPVSFTMKPLPLKKLVVCEELTFHISSDTPDLIDAMHSDIVDDLPDSLETYWEGGPTIDHEKVLDKELGFMSSRPIDEDGEFTIYEFLLCIEFTVLVKI